MLSKHRAGRAVLRLAALAKLFCPPNVAGALRRQFLEPPAFVLGARRSPTAGRTFCRRHSQTGQPAGLGSQRMAGGIAVHRDVDNFSRTTARHRLAAPLESAVGCSSTGAGCSMPSAINHPSRVTPLGFWNTNMTKPLNPPVRILLGPGPSEIHPRVLEALAKPTVGHLDPYYLELMNGMQQMLREVFRTKNEMTMAISGTGSAGMEAAVVNVIEPGDAMVVCVNGVFGGRMVDVAAARGRERDQGRTPVGRGFYAGRFERRSGQGQAESRRHRDGGNLDRGTAAAGRDFQAGARRRRAVAGRYRHGAGRHSRRSRQMATRRRLFRHAEMPQLPAGIGADHVRPEGDGKNSRPQDRRCKAGIST